MRRTCRGVVLAGAVVLAGRALAQDAAFLVPEPRSPQVGAPVALHIERAGAAPGARAPWPADRASWMFIRARGDQENRHDVQPDGPGSDTVSFAMADAAVTVVGLDLDPVVTSMEAGAFAAFRAERLPPAAPDVKTGSVGAPAAPANAQIRVRRFESATVLIRKAEPGVEPAASPTATAKAGQRAEVRAVMDPTALRAGSDLPVRVFAGVGAVSGARVRALHVPSGRMQTVTADSSAIGKIRLDETGVWRVEFHHLEKCPDPAEADWDLYTATLNFEITRPAKEAE